MRAYYYTAVVEDQGFSSIRPLIDWLEYNGFTVVTKMTKEFVDTSGRREVQGNIDIDLPSMRWNWLRISIRWCFFRVTEIFDHLSRQSSAKR